jgi:hypothetical protein
MIQKKKIKIPPNSKPYWEPEAQVNCDPHLIADEVATIYFKRKSPTT